MTAARAVRYALVDKWGLDLWHEVHDLLPGSSYDYATVDGGPDGCTIAYWKGGPGHSGSITEHADGTAMGSIVDLDGAMFSADAEDVRAAVVAVVARVVAARMPEVSLCAQ